MSRMIHIIDDDDQVRNSLGLLLETSGHKVRTFHSGDSYIAEEPDLDNAVIILDVRMPGRDGVETLGYIRKRSTRAPVIMISGHGDIPLAVKAMQAGANDFVEKPFAAGRIISAIDHVDRSTASGQEAGKTQVQTPDPLSVLTPREREVALAISEGKLNKIVAYDLGISVRTVETHRARLMSKLGIASLPELVRLVIARPSD